MEKKRPPKSPPEAVEGPVRGPDDIDRAGSGGPYGHTVPERKEPAPPKQG